MIAPTATMIQSNTSDPMLEDVGGMSVEWLVNHTHSFNWVVVKSTSFVSLIDVGFTQADVKSGIKAQYNRGVWENPNSVLEKCGVTANDIKHVVIGHKEFTLLIDGDPFPNAEFYVDKSEFEAWVSLFGKKPNPMAIGRALTDPPDVMKLFQLASKKRLHYIGDNEEVSIPGIHCRRANGHSRWTSMFVKVEAVEGGFSWEFGGEGVYKVCKERILSKSVAPLAQSALQNCSVPLVTENVGMYWAPFRGKSVDELFPLGGNPKGMRVTRLACVSPIQG